MAATRRDFGDAVEFAARRWGSTARAVAVVKAAVEAVTTLGTGADLAAFRGAATEFFQAVAQQTIIGRLSGLRRVPLRSRILTGTGTVAYWVGEGQAKPISSTTFAATSLSPLKVLAMTVATLETLRDSLARCRGCHPLRPCCA